MRQQGEERAEQASESQVQPHNFKSTQTLSAAQQGEWVYAITACQARDPVYGELAAGFYW